MGPPPSPRETRRSGRRSAPSASTSTSKSPDSDQPPKQKEPSSRPAPSSSTNNGRNKRLKQEDLEDVVDDRRVNPAPSVASNGSNHGTSNGKGKRKGKDKDKQALSEEQLEEASDPLQDDSELAAGDEEEQGITRCVCGNTEDDPDAGEFMIQCEGCKVWQHGPCMGFMTEDQVHDDDYYCEECRPEMHPDVFKRLATHKKGRQANHHSSNASHVSRSRSPSQLKQQSKRRNTMNSRDFDESLKEIMEATAAEAAGKDPTSASAKDEPSGGNDGDDDIEGQVNGKKKRKRTEDDVPPKKRTRSASTTSERQGSALPRDETPVSAAAKPVSQAPAPTKGGGRNKRGGRKAVVTEISAAVDGDEVASNPPTGTTTKRQGNVNRKGGATKRPPLSHAVSQNSSGVNQEHTTSRARNPAGNNQHTASANADTRAYRNSHAYAVSQQPLLTSWGLPDYLAHLEHMLPTNTPQPLEVRAGTSSSVPGPRGESAERTMERGVKVKWPSKRMSVGDMNKRVRALVEWVGREQANALDRERRREALEKVLREQATNIAADHEGDVIMAVDDPARPESTAQQSENDPPASSTAPKPVDKESTSSTMRLMEELMEELISFQERFGPGAKSRERERRQGHTASSLIS